MISMTQDTWEKLKLALVENHGKKVIMISWVMKRDLGFTTREDNFYVDDGDHGSDWHNFVHLDFDDEKKEMWFTLKYAEYCDTPHNVWWQLKQAGNNRRYK